ncbi:MAG: DUF1854 domain-containing protein [Lachnospiraceae bacterium]|nr:DUF1854 domain-containing protein [Lachnospiraceae bacterium]
MEETDKTLKFFESAGGFLGAKVENINTSKIGPDDNKNGTSNTEAGCDLTTYERVHAVRLFPFTDPAKYISIRVGSEAGEELAIIEDLADLSPEQRELVKRDLELNYFLPVINKILSIKDEYGYAYFHVITDKGPVRFAINMGGTNVTKLSETRLLITDINENRFEVRDVTKLTKKEQRKLDLFL